METKSARINPMCTDCPFFGKNCRGTTCQSWTNCIYKALRKSPETHDDETIKNYMPNCKKCRHHAPATID